MDSSMKFATKMTFFFVLIVIASEMCKESEAREGGVAVWKCFNDKDCKLGCTCVYENNNRYRYCQCPGKNSEILDIQSQIPTN